MSTTKQIPLNHGVCNAVTITSYPDAGTWNTKYVTLSFSYARTVPPGYPDPNAGSEVAKNQTWATKGIANGTRVQLFAHEADALVAASCAVYS